MPVDATAYFSLKPAAKVPGQLKPYCEASEKSRGGGFC